MEFVGTAQAARVREAVERGDSAQCIRALIGKGGGVMYRGDCSVPYIAYGHLGHTPRVPIMLTGGVMLLGDDIPGVPRFAFFDKVYITRAYAPGGASLTLRLLLRGAAYSVVPGPHPWHTAVAEYAANTWRVTWPERAHSYDDLVRMRRAAA